MPMQLLDRLCRAQLPLKIEDPEEIQKCAVLRGAGLIEAELPPLLHPRGRWLAYSGQAIVLCVTSRGHAAAAKKTEPAT